MQVRTAPGVKGLLLCHADAQPIPDSDRHEVTLTRLYDELKSGTCTSLISTHLQCYIPQDAVAVGDVPFSGMLISALP